MDAIDVLFARCLESRDEHAWEALWIRERPWLRRVLVRTLHQMNRPVGITDLELDDLQQEVMLRLLRRLRRRNAEVACRSQAHVRAYLIRVVESVVIDHFRRRDADKRNGGLTRSPCSDPASVQATREVDPETWTLLRERFRAIARGCCDAAGDRRPRAKTRALALVLFAGYASREAAWHSGAGVTAGSIDSMVSRARARLRARGIELPRRGRARVPRRRAA